MREAILTILKSGTGHGVEFAGRLNVYPSTNGKFAIEIDRSEYVYFDNAEQAVDKYLSLRQERELGFDFETKGA